jgi:KaiC/GvpD/RAD55 family RecA-like ATPase
MYTLETDPELAEMVREGKALGFGAAAPELPPLEVYRDEPGASAANAVEPFPVAALDEISDEVRAQIVQNVFEVGTVAVIAGAPNTGKTFLAVHLAVHMAAGESWFGCKVSGGPILYVAAEAPGSVRTRARLAASQGFANKRLPFYVMSHAPGLGSEIDSPGDTLRLIATIRAVSSIEGMEVKMVIIDTVASVLADGEENADGMLRLAGSAKFIAAETGAAVTLVHHPSKGDPTSLRGHSSLAAAVDTILSITMDDNTGIRAATLTKSRDSAAGRQFFFNLEAVKLPTLDSFGDPRTSCIVIPVTVPLSQRRRPGGKAQEQLLSEIERRYRTGETHMDEAAIRKAGHGLGMHRNSIPKALKGLRISGFVVGEAARITLKYPPEST